MDSPRDDTQNQQGQNDQQKQAEAGEKQQLQADQQQEKAAQEKITEQHAQNNLHAEKQKEQQPQQQTTPQVQQEAKSTGDAKFGKSEWTSRGEVMRATQSNNWVGREKFANQTLKTLPAQQTQAAVLQKYATAAKAQQPVRGQSR